MKTRCKRINLADATVKEARKVMTFYSYAGFSATTPPNADEDSTKGLRVFQTLPSDSSDLPYTNGYQNSLVEIQLHPSTGQRAQLYFSAGHPMTFRTGWEAWRTMLDSTNFGQYIKNWLDSNGYKPS